MDRRSKILLTRKPAGVVCGGVLFSSGNVVEEGELSGTERMIQGSMAEVALPEMQK